MSEPGNGTDARVAGSRYTDDDLRRIGRVAAQLLGRGTLNGLEFSVDVASNEHAVVADGAPRLRKVIRRLRREIHERTP